MLQAHTHIIQRVKQHPCSSRTHSTALPEPSVPEIVECCFVVSIFILGLGQSAVQRQFREIRKHAYEDRRAAFRRADETIAVRFKATAANTHIGYTHGMGTSHRHDRGSMSTPFQRELTAMPCAQTYSSTCCR